MSDLMAKPKDEEGRTRIDKWLWAIRIYKSRSLATHACRNGDVLIEGRRVKPSHIVRVGDVIETNREGWLRRIEVVNPIEQRVGAKLAVDFYKDLSLEGGPKSRMERIEEGIAFRARGEGRPTKRDRREWERKVNPGKTGLRCAQQ